MQRFKDIVNSVKLEYTDVKAEVIIADLIEKGIDISDIEIILSSAFERNYKKDLSDVYVDMVKRVISLHITRNSLYDNLPEGLFHPVTRYSNLDPDDRKKEFKKQKQEEGKSRKFFRPYDKEFLAQKAQLEIETRKLIQDLLAESEKWFINETNIPRQYFRRLVKYLPFTNKVKGNLGLTAQCLSEILETKISANSYYKTQNPTLSAQFDENIMGSSYLGENLICGNSLSEDVLVWEFAVLLNDEKMLEQYVDIDKGLMKNLINRFYAYFVPLEIIVETRIICSTHSTFYLQVDTEYAEPEIDHSIKNIYLGYNAML